MALVAGARAKGSDFQNLEVKGHAPLDQGTTTSTTYTTTRSGATSPVGVAFTAPPSGKVDIHWRSGLFNANSTQFTLCSFQILNGITLGSGTPFHPFSDSYNIGEVGTANRDKGSTALITGLTAGNDYNVTLGFRVQSAANAGTALRVEVSVHPCIS